ncbi:hypothetical protein IE53DRAFT_368476 [Violaceomyces palustris]|uniref:Uncharacterized protein n=1 Tax=Violaceomyces palustris TaxID=1673888 RepID=A0ACD0NYX4_9BASI|nr:hypothetical protein IE53DRAFT_368476 [Violaceomyces palustris]
MSVAKKRRLSSTAFQAVQAQVPPVDPEKAKERSKTLIQAGRQDSVWACIQSVNDQILGTRSQRQIAWSRHNLIAYSSSSSNSNLGPSRPHIVLRTIPTASAPGQRTEVAAHSHLFPPEQTNPASNNVLGPSYGPPTQITFSHCGFYLVAYFPPVPSSPSQHGLAATQLTSNGNSEGQLANNVPDAQPDTSALGSLCIWSRATTSSLNDWKLVQTVRVAERSSDISMERTGRANALKVNAHGQQVSTSSSTTESDGPKDLQGGIKEIIWLGNDRQWRVTGQLGGNGKTAYARDSARGPRSFHADGIGLVQDVQAFLVFGNHGEVTLLHCRPKSQKAEQSAADAQGMKQKPLFDTLHSSLFIPALTPAPPTLDAEGGDSPKNGSWSTPLHVKMPRLSHLAVGMQVEEPIVIVASKTRKLFAGSEDILRLTEIRVYLDGDATIMTTRPLPSFPIWKGELMEDDMNLANPRSPSLSHLSFVNSDPAQATVEGSVKGRPSGLRLLAALSYQNIDGGIPSTILQIWDIVRDGDVLSDAFSQLECRKGSNASSRLDWHANLALTKREPGRTLTGVVSSPEFHKGGAVLVSFISSQDEPLGVKQNGDVAIPPGRLVETLQWLDNLKFDSIPTSHVVQIPSKARVRSDMVISPNGILVGTTAASSSSSGGTSNGLVIWSLPDVDGVGFEGAVDKAGKLAGLALLRRTDALDVVRALFPKGDHAFLNQALRVTARCIFLPAPASPTSPSGTDSKGEGVPTTIAVPGRKNETTELRGLSFGQVMRLLELQLSVVRSWSSVDSSDSEKGASERLVFELALCHELIKSNRLVKSIGKAETKPKKESGEGGAAGKSGFDGEHGGKLEQVSYKLESVWPLIAHVQWILSVLDNMARFAILSSASRELSSSASAESAKGDEDSGRFDGKDKINIQPDAATLLFVHKVPRRLLLLVLKGLGEFKHWILSTSQRENLPSQEEMDQAITSGAGLGLSSGGYGGADVMRSHLAISEQLELARDALRHVLVGASVDLESAIKVLTNLENDLNDLDRKGDQEKAIKVEKTSDGRPANGGHSGNEGDGTGGKANGEASRAEIQREIDSSWWSYLHRSTSKREPDGWKEEEKEKIQILEGIERKLSTALVEPEVGALVDSLTLFLKPGDILDERTSLEPSHHPLRFPPQDSGDALRSDHPSLGPIATSKLERDIVRKTFLKPWNPPSVHHRNLDAAARRHRNRVCLRCGSFSSSSTVRSSLNGEKFGGKQTKASSMAMTIDDDPDSGIGFEKAFDKRCLCGGCWWSI